MQGRGHASGVDDVDAPCALADSRRSAELSRTFPQESRVLSRRAFLARTAALAGGVTVAARALEAESAAAKPIAVTVYKSPTCGCCKKWVDHVESDRTLSVTTRDLPDVAPIKQELGVPSALASCHTAVAAGYAFEGHVPVDLMTKVLRERPKIAGLAVPGMPVGSPGMEVGGRKDAYDVVAFTKDGRTSVYAKR